MNMLTPVAIWLGSISWMPRFLKQITWIDKMIQRLTRGRWSLLRLAGLPSMMLTVAGRKTGIPRTTPMLCVPVPEGYLVAGSNFGGPATPAWVFNTRAAEQEEAEVHIRVNGATMPARPRELVGDERARAWNTMVKTWPNYTMYENNTERSIAVFLMEPIT